MNTTLGFCKCGCRWGCSQFCFDGNAIVWFQKHGVGTVLYTDERTFFSQFACCDKVYCLLHPHLCLHTYFWNLIKSGGNHHHHYHRCHRCFFKICFVKEEKETKLKIQNQKFCFIMPRWLYFKVKNQVFWVTINRPKMPKKMLNVTTGIMATHCPSDLVSQVAWAQISWAWASKRLHWVQLAGNKESHPLNRGLNLSQLINLRVDWGMSEITPSKKVWIYSMP